MIMLMELRSIEKTMKLNIKLILSALFLLFINMLLKLAQFSVKNGILKLQIVQINNANANER